MVKLAGTDHIAKASLELMTILQLQPMTSLLTDPHQPREGIVYTPARAWTSPGCLEPGQTAPPPQKMTCSLTGLTGALWKSVFLASTKQLQSDSRLDHARIDYQTPELIEATEGHSHLL